MEDKQRGSPSGDIEVTSKSTSFHERVNILVRELERGDNVWVVAQTGYGKTVSALKYASRLKGNVIYTSPYHSSLADAFLSALSFREKPKKITYVVGQERVCKNKELLERVRRLGLPSSFACMICPYGGRLALSIYASMKARRGLVEILAERQGYRMRELESYGQYISRRLEKTLEIIPENAVRDIYRYAGTRLLGFLRIITPLEEKFPREDCVYPLYFAREIYSSALTLVPHAVFSVNRGLVYRFAQRREGDKWKIAKPTMIFDEYDEFLLEPDTFPFPRRDTREALLQELEYYQSNGIGGEVVEWLERVVREETLWILLDPEKLREYLSKKKRVTVKLLNPPSIGIQKYTGFLTRLYVQGVLEDLVSSIGFLPSLGVATILSEEVLAPWGRRGVLFFLKYPSGASGEPVLASYDTRLSFIFNTEKPVRRRVILLSATSISLTEHYNPYIVNAGGVSYPLVSVGSRDLAFRRIEIELEASPRITIRFVNLPPVTTSSGGIDYGVVDDYMDYFLSLLPSYKYDKLVIAQNKRVAYYFAVGLTAKYCNPTGKTKELLEAYERRGEVGGDYLKLSCGVRRNVYITWFRSRLTRGVSLKGALDIVYVVGSPYTPPQIFSPEPTVEEYFGSTPVDSTALNIPLEGRGFLVHGSADINSFINEVVQAVGRAIRHADKVLGDPLLLKTEFPDYKLLVVIPKFLAKKMLRFAPKWFLKYIYTII